MSSGPEGKFKKQSRNRLTLKSAIAALAIIGAQPAEAQYTKEQDTQSQTLRDVPKANIDQSGARIRESFAQHKRGIERLRKYFGADDPIVKEEMHTLELTEPLLQDGRYIQGVIEIERKGGKLHQIVGSTHPDVVMDAPRLAKILERIPDEIVGHYRMNGSDLSEDARYSYHRTGVVELAQSLSERGIILSGEELNRVLDIRVDVPDISETLTRLQSEGGQFLSITEVLKKIRDKYFDPSALSDPEFVQGLIDLGKSDISLGELSSAPDEKFKSRIVEAVRDPVFVKTLIELRKMKMPMWSSDMLSVAPEVYRSPSYLGNMRIALEKKVSFLSARMNEPAMAQEGLATLLLSADKDHASDVFDAARKYGSDPVVWQRAIESASKHKDDARYMTLFYQLDSDRIRNDEYMARVDAHMRDPENRKTFDKYLARFEIDTIYAREIGGINPKDAHINEYRRALERHQSDPVMMQILSLYHFRILRGPILRMNELHDGRPELRLEQLKDIDTKTLLDVMVVGGADAYLSTFRLIYNGNGHTGSALKHTFLSKVRTEYGSLHSFFRETKPSEKTFGSLLELLSQNNLIDTFLSDIGTLEQQQQVLREFLFDSSKGMSETQALALDDLLHSTKNESVRNFVFNSVRDLRDKSMNNRPKYIADLLIAEYFRDIRSVPLWAKESIERYGALFPDVRQIEEGSVFRVENGVSTNTQLHFFYDDRGPSKPEHTWDGHMSFRNFIQSLGGSVTWDAAGVIQSIVSGKGIKITDEGDYVKIQKTDTKSKKEVVMFANKPDRKDENVAKIQSDLMTQFKPQTVVHRGHSYHAPKTIMLLNGDIALVNLGSCGGAKNISDVLEKAPSAQVMATKGVGTMLVNDTLITAIDKTLMSQGRVNWDTLRGQLDSEFKRRGGDANERWGHYQLPHQNRTAHLIAALKKLPKD